MKGEKSAPRIGNVPSTMKAEFGNDVNNVTSRNFINLWTDQYHQKMIESGLPMTFPGGFSATP